MKKRKTQIIFFNVKPIKAKQYIVWQYKNISNKATFKSRNDKGNVQENGYL